MPDISIIVPTLDPDPTFGWEDQLAAAAVDREVIPRDGPTASGARNAGHVDGHLRDIRGGRAGRVLDHQDPAE
jgi:hypothetical protein